MAQRIVYVLREVGRRLLQSHAPFPAEPPPAYLYGPFRWSVGDSLEKHGLLKLLSLATLKQTGGPASVEQVEERLIDKGRLDWTPSRDEVGDALDAIVRNGLALYERGNVKLRCTRDQLVAEAIATTLEAWGPLQARDLSSYVKQKLGGDVGIGLIERIAANLARDGRRLTQRSILGVDLYCLNAQLENVGKRGGLYRSSPKRAELRFQMGLIDEEELEQRTRGLLREAGELRKRPSNFGEYLDYLQKQEWYGGQVITVMYVPAREAVYQETTSRLDPKLLKALRNNGVKKLYSHQAMAIDAVLAGKNVVITTPNASGKTQCYQIPIFETLLRDPHARVLYIAPTKALAEDQLERFRQFGQSIGEARLAEKLADAYHGYTSVAEKDRIRQSFPPMIFTNEHMLHYGILPNLDQWMRFFKRLRFVVLDEIHWYTGVFGSHVANILRRLNLICESLGITPQYICASATISNPREFAELLTGRKMELIETNGAPTSPKKVVFWNPSKVIEDGGFRSPYTDATNLFVENVRHHIQTLAFARSRNIAELLNRWAKDRLSSPSDLTHLVATYRAGFMPKDRRAIERQLKDGTIMGVACTSALELGVDIASVDSTILVGYPGTVASVWQRANRSGRRGEEALVFFVGLENPLDQYFMANPNHLFEAKYEMAVIDPDNPNILEQHVKCAVEEVSKDLLETFLTSGVGKEYTNLEAFVEKALAWLKEKKTSKELVGYKLTPQKTVKLRAGSQDSYEIVLAGERIGDSDRTRTFKELHEGALYLHQGETYAVTELNLAEKRVTVEPYYSDHRTIPRVKSYITIEEVSGAADLSEEVGVGLGTVTVTETVTGFSKVDQNGRLVSRGDLDLPPTSVRTQSLWLRFGHDLRERFRERGTDLGGGLHAIEHLLKGLLPLYARCDTADLGGASFLTHRNLEGYSVIFVYENNAGGVGLARAGYERVRAIIGDALSVIRKCGCKTGCPLCIHASYCERENENLDKEAAIELLMLALSQTPAPDAL